MSLRPTPDAYVKGDNPAVESDPERPRGSMHACQCGDAGVPCPES
jgi:hypothetical protein